ncbi:hypothetical protein MKX03_010452 [Papaver bracteatum]|nr:hypothetical protein MKX03_010452 [Papaver bracteatum]
MSTDKGQEPLINFNQPTGDGLVAEKPSGALRYWITVPKLSAYGIIEDYPIPRRFCWLKILRDDWGITDDEIKVFIKTSMTQKFRIEVCGWYMGYGVIVRDGMRNPIIVISRVADDYVSPFYHELQGVSLGLKLAMKYGISHFDFNCVSEAIFGYVMRTWNHKYDCGCPLRDNPMNPGEKMHYCVKCSVSILDEVGERKNAYKILPLIDEFYYDAIRFACPAKAVWHLANLGIHQELRIHEIEEDEEIAEILYKDVFGHGSLQEVVLQQQQLILQKKQLKLLKQRYLAEERVYQERLLKMVKPN